MFLCHGQDQHNSQFERTRTQRPCPYERISQIHHLLNFDPLREEGNHSTTASVKFWQPTVIEPPLPWLLPTTNISISTRPKNRRKTRKRRNTHTPSTPPKMQPYTYPTQSAPDAPKHPHHYSDTAPPAQYSAQNHRYDPSAYTSNAAYSQFP